MNQPNESFKPISEDFYAGGQPDAAIMQQLAAQGVKSVVNLRSPNEPGTLSDEPQQATAAGWEYVNIPLGSGEADDSLTGKVLQTLKNLPTPVFFHCGAGTRAAAMALIALATQQELNREQVIAKAEEIGVSLEQPHLKRFLASLE